MCRPVQTTGLVRNFVLHMEGLHGPSQTWEDDTVSVMRILSYVDTESIFWGTASRSNFARRRTLGFYRVLTSLYTVFPIKLKILD